MSNKGFLLRITVNLLLAVDQLANTILLGHPDETISSRLGRSKENERYFWVKWFRLFVDTLFFFDYTVDKSGNKIGHCESSILPLEQQTFRKLDYEIWSWNKKS